MQHVNGRGHINHFAQVRRLVAAIRPTSFKAGLIFIDPSDDCDVVLVEEVSVGVWNLETRGGDSRQATSVELEDWTPITDSDPQLVLNIA